MHFLRIFIMSAVVWFEMRPGVCRLFCFQTQERKIILLFVGAVGKRHWGGPERQAGWPSAPLQAGSMQYGASVGKEDTAGLEDSLLVPRILLKISLRSSILLRILKDFIITALIFPPGKSWDYPGLLTLLVSSRRWQNWNPCVCVVIHCVPSVSACSQFVSGRFGVHLSPSCICEFTV